MDISNLLFELGEIDAETKGQLEWRKQDLLLRVRRYPDRWTLSRALDEYDRLSCTMLSDYMVRIRKMLIEKKIFDEGCRKSRTNPLRDVLIEIHSVFNQEKGRLPEFSEVIIALKKMAKSNEHPVIQKVTNTTIFWTDKKGSDRVPTSYKQLKGRITPIRKLFPS